MESTTLNKQNNTLMDELATVVLGPIADGDDAGLTQASTPGAAVEDLGYFMEEGPTLG